MYIFRRGCVGDGCWRFYVLERCVMVVERWVVDVGWSRRMWRFF